jgi:succinate dehydrogenase/fumarate reductase flavoprotein subunit
MTNPAETYDVVVIGSGAGGLSAALTAAVSGLSVAVFEKSEFVGGSTAVSGGAVWIPGNRLMEGVGCHDSRAAVRAYLAATLGKRLKTDIIEAFLENGPEMVDFMAANTQVKFAARSLSPDYQSEVTGAAMGGRTIDPLPFDARLLGRNFNKLRPPLRSFMVLGGMMVNTKDIKALLNAFSSVSDFAHSTRLVLKYAIDRLRHRRGTRLLLGNALAARLYRSALDRNIPILTGVTAGDLVLDNGKVVGVNVDVQGQVRIIAARVGVVLATGGFPANVSERANFMPNADNHRTMAPADNVGEGISMALRAGARMEVGNKGAALWAPISRLTMPDGKERLCPHLIIDRQKPGLIAVDQKGKRFVNEATAYHEFVEAMHGNPDAVPAFLICDAVFLRRYGLGLVRAKYDLPRPFVRAGYLLTAQTLGALADVLGIDRNNLAEAVAGMNEAADTGVDLVFGKGSTRYNQYLGDPDHKPNPCLGPISTAPFYAVKVWPGDIGTATGLVVDDHARVLNGANQPVDGLFACGNDMNSIMAGSYPAAGITLGPALTFGYIAGRTLAQAATSEKRQATNS